MTRANFTLTVSTAEDAAPEKSVMTSIFAALRTVTQYAHWDDAGDGTAFLSDSKWYETQTDLATLSAMFSGLRFSVHVDETSGRQSYFDALDGETDVRIGDMDFPAITLWPTVAAVPPFTETETPQERINALVDTIDYDVTPTGAQRGAEAVNALAGLNSHADAPQTTIEDALSSLRHACRFLGLDFDALDRRAFAAFCADEPPKTPRPAKTTPQANDADAKGGIDPLSANRRETMKVWTITASDDDRNTKTAIALSAEDADKAALSSAGDLWKATKNMGPMPSVWQEAIRQLRDYGLNDAIEIKEHTIPPLLFSGSGLSVWSIMADTEDGTAHHVVLSETTAAEIARGVIEPIWQKHHEGEPMPEAWRDALDQMQERGCIDTVSIAEHQIPAKLMTSEDAALIRELADLAAPDSTARRRAEAMLSRLAA